MQAYVNSNQQGTWGSGLRLFDIVSSARLWRLGKEDMASAEIGVLPSRHTNAVWSPAKRAASASEKEIAEVNNRYQLELYCGIVPSNSILRFFVFSINGYDLSMS